MVFFVSVFQPFASERIARDTDVDDDVDDDAGRVRSVVAVHEAPRAAQRGGPSDGAVAARADVPRERVRASHRQSHQRRAADREVGAAAVVLLRAWPAARLRGAGPEATADGRPARTADVRRSSLDDRPEARLTLPQRGSGTHRLITPGTLSFVLRSLITYII